MKLFSLVSKATSTVLWISLYLAVANAAALTGVSSFPRISMMGGLDKQDLQRQSSQNIVFCDGLDGTMCKTPIQLEEMFGVCMPQLLSGTSSVATAGQIVCTITT